MAKETITNFEIVKSLFSTTPATWDGRINLESAAYWDAAKVVIADDSYAGLRNQIFEALLNRIAITVIKKKSFTNPLAMFKMGYMPYGDTLQEIAIDVAEAQQYKTGNQNQFEVSEADVKAAYHTVNRQQFYKRTVYDAELQKAFLNEGGLSNMINSIVQTLSESNTIDEFIYCKKLINSYVANTAYPIQATQKLSVPNISARPRTETNLKYFLEDVKKRLRKMSFPTREYNAANLMDQVAPSELVLIMNSDIVAINEVNNLSAAFNPQYLDLNIPIIPVDQVDATNSSVIGAIVSRRTFDIRTTKEVFATAYNAQALYTNYFFHIHQIYTASPFETLVLITEEK